FTVPTGTPSVSAVSRSLNPCRSRSTSTAWSRPGRRAKTSVTSIASWSNHAGNLSDTICVSPATLATIGAIEARRNPSSDGAGPAEDRLRGSQRVQISEDRQHRFLSRVLVLVAGFVGADPSHERIERVDQLVER